jgi:hypothetical protein
MIDFLLNSCIGIKKNLKQDDQDGPDVQDKKQSKIFFGFYPVHLVDPGYPVEFLHTLEK